MPTISKLSATDSYTVPLRGHANVNASGRAIPHSITSGSGGDDPDRNDEKGASIEKDEVGNSKMQIISNDERDPSGNAISEPRPSDTTSATSRLDIANEETAEDQEIPRENRPKQNRGKRVDEIDAATLGGDGHAGGRTSNPGTGRLM